MTDLRKTIIDKSKGIQYVNISRRSFLKGTAVVVGALALGGCGDGSGDKTATAPTTSSPAAPNPPKVGVATTITAPHYILPDYTKCVGCNICMIYCSMKQCGVTDLYQSNIQVYGINLKGAMIDIPVLCMKCKDTPCVKACPPAVTALSVNSTTGAVVVDNTKCTACGLCVTVCGNERTGCLRLSKDKMSLVGLCDLCGGSPECVVNCPENCLQLVLKSSSVDGRHFAQKPEVIARQVRTIVFGV